MKLSRTIAYGIHATIQLAQLPGDAPTPASQLARQGRLPERFLVQILRNLVIKGVLTSACGVLGGYSLARPAGEITLRDIVESFDNPLEPCLTDLDCMSQGVLSALATTLDHASEAARIKLQTLSLADLVRAETNNTAPICSQPPAPLGINLQLLASNGYENTPDDSAATH